jgi:hypothetical protein
MSSSSNTLGPPPAVPRAGRLDSLPLALAVLRQMQVADVIDGHAGPLPAHGVPQSVGAAHFLAAGYVAGCPGHPPGLLS